MALPVVGAKRCAAPLMLSRSTASLAFLNSFSARWASAASVISATRSCVRSLTPTLLDALCSTASIVSEDISP